MADFLVTGTDTAVGKTVVAAALVAALREAGIRAVGFKPVETGVDGAVAADSELLQRASGESPAAASPLLRLPEPLAPAVAAERAGTSVRAEDIEQRIEQLRADGYTVVVEGAGGVLVPLTWEKAWERVPGTLFDDRHEKGSRNPFPYQNPEPRAQSPFYTVLDLAERYALNTIIVARAGLGTLNHVALTVAALRARSIPIKAVVLNGGQAWPPADLAEATNPDFLARMLGGARIIYVPRHEGPAMNDAVEAIAATVPYLRSLIA